MLGILASLKRDSAATYLTSAFSALHQLISANSLGISNNQKIVLQNLQLN
jgi:hypothetical protein